MKKFNKKLTIDVPEEHPPLHTQENQSQSLEPSSQNRFLSFKEDENEDNADPQKSEIRKFVEFQEFNVQKIQQMPGQIHAEENKRKIWIQLPPDRGINTEHDSSQRKGNMNIEVIERQSELEDKFKEPPAPSKGSKNKMFVFPTTPPHKQKPHKEQTLEDLKKNFERERQEFYKEKSKLEKQLLIRNGQIDMLQKIVKDKYSVCEYPTYKQKIHERKQVDEYQAVLLEKDLQINELLEKITELNEIILTKNQSLNKKILENSTLESIVESLKNQIYIYEKKEINDKTTKKFYSYKQEQKEKMMEQQWKEEPKTHYAGGGLDFGIKGLESLQKRIEKVKMNRLQFDERHKIKSDIGYSKTTTNKNRLNFDFKNHLYEKRAHLNHTRIF